jgi:hypothetical protein
MDGSMAAATHKVVSFKLKDGRELHFHSLSAMDYVSLSEQALREHRREKIKAWTENADMMPEDSRQEWIRDAFKRAEEITIDKLPAMRMEIPVSGNGSTRTAVVPYPIWWMSETIQGKMHAAWLSMRKCPGQEAMKVADVDELFRQHLDELEEAANLVGDLSTPRLPGNSSGPPVAGPEDKKERRRARRRARE